MEKADVDQLITIAERLGKAISKLAEAQRSTNNACLRILDNVNGLADRRDGHQMELRTMLFAIQKDVALSASQVVEARREITGQHELLTEKELNRTGRDLEAFARTAKLVWPVVMKLWPVLFAAAGWALHYLWGVVRHGS